MPSSLTTETLAVVLFSMPPFPSMDVVVWLTSAELRTGSLVMTLMVPPMADAPYSAEPPPRTTSMRSIMFEGICSKPYMPLSEVKIGRESINI